eukprot:CAMPEP_0170548282 /NCGR_PEP_ID=MMETSP0211-20121228/6614_1 /TAXON_ID=311385 /ORGANISM="Pseudokeronopsis sp., Strain OXSARD2" /LENGTH=118 /DNA_ID=CAMNT_0010853753 /DNA_START=221 /DNA_END=577 /DNA_ORIENTATION=+
MGHVIELIGEVEKHSKNVEKFNQQTQGLFLEENEEKLEKERKVKRLIIEGKSHELLKSQKIKPPLFYQRKQRKLELQQEIEEKNKIADFIIKNENFKAVKAFYEKQKGMEFQCLHCQQ